LEQYLDNNDLWSSDRPNG